MIRLSFQSTTIFYLKRIPTYLRGGRSDSQHKERVGLVRNAPKFRPVMWAESKSFILNVSQMNKPQYHNRSLIKLVNYTTLIISLCQLILDAALTIFRAFLHLFNRSSMWGPQCNFLSNISPKIFVLGLEIICCPYRVNLGTLCGALSLQKWTMCGFVVEGSKPVLPALLVRHSIVLGNVSSMTCIEELE